MGQTMQDEDVQIPVTELLAALLEHEGSDLHLTAGVQPVVRVHGDLVRLMEFPILTPRALQGMIYAILPQKMREKFEQELELDMSYALPGQGPVPCERVFPAGLDRRRVPADPVRDQDVE